VISIRRSSDQLRGAATACLSIAGPLSWDLDLLQDPLDHLSGVRFSARLVGERDPVPEDVIGDGLDVLGRDESAMTQEGVRARGQFR